MLKKKGKVNHLKTFFDSHPARKIVYATPSIKNDAEIGEQVKKILKKF